MPVNAGVEPVVLASSFDNYVSVRHLVAHALAAKIGAGECFEMRDLFFNLQESENHLRVSAATREDEKDKISFVRFRANVVAANAPGRRGGPEVWVVIDLRALLTTGRGVDGLECTRNIDVSIHCISSPEMVFVPNRLSLGESRW